MKLEVPATPPAVMEAVDALREFCSDQGAPLSVSQELSLALEEILANVVNHGYQGDATKFAQVELRCEGQSVVAVVRDQAAAYDPLSAPEPDLESDLDDRPIGGLGIHLVRELMDEVSYERADGENRVTFRKTWDSDPQPD